MTPRATYRLQFHKAFPFAAALPLAPYLAALGVSHVYASPIATARAGSTHGYDVVDPTAINPELGGEEGFRELAAALRAHGVGIVLDILPNHMAVGGADNRWWLDVLEKGRESEHADFFDIDWDTPDPAVRGKVMAPFLGRPYGEALAAGDIRLAYDAAADSLAAIAHGCHRFPIRRADHQAVLDEGLARFDPADEAGRARLHELLERQNFRLAWWRVAGDEVNWRRFFDITELAAVRIDRPEVFETLNALPLRLYAEGLIDGLRADHIDGLANPGAYCREMRRRLTELDARRPPDAPPGPVWFVVEKVLAPDEDLPGDWGCDGTTGYDFMNEVAALLHDPAGAAPLTRHWTKTSGRPPDFETEERTARHQVLTRDFAGQLEATARAFAALARSDTATRDVTHGAIRRGLIALLTVFPAYRTYGTARETPPSDAPLLKADLERARDLAAPAEMFVLERIIAWMAGRGPGSAQDQRLALRRFQQLSAPVSAKAVEDTALYRYGRLLSRNDVGADPDRLGSSAARFHETCLRRAATFPAAMLTTATHDHKRGEDVRARLAVLSEIPEVWIDQAERWAAENGAAAQGIDPGDEYQLYQMLAGALPPERDDAAMAEFGERMAGWLVKALREAKLRSLWAEPDEDYEAACLAFLAGLLGSGEFRQSLFAFVDRIAPAGALNGLTQAFLRCLTPGVPDTYQGAEFWDFSLVDPDNRRPVDFAARSGALAQAPDEPLDGWREGRPKQRVIAAALRLRAEQPDLFASGDYQPLEVRGARAGSLIAFARGRGETAVVAAAALRCAPAAIDAGRPRPDPGWWADTEVVTASAAAAFTDRLTGRRHRGGEALPAAELFAGLPVTLLCPDA